MPASAYDSFYFRDRYGSPAMRAIWDDRAMVQRWLDVEAALAATQAELGLVPASAAREIARRARVDLIDLAAMKREFDTTWNPVMPLVNAVTDSSFRVRLAHMTYIDSARHDTVMRYGFLIESDTALAKRIAADQIHSNNVYAPMTDPRYMTLVAVFEYLIGNTDWSVWKRHNIAIFQPVAEPRPLLAVPYDFDFSGAVNAPYASPPPGCADRCSCRTMAGS